MGNESLVSKSPSELIQKDRKPLQEQLLSFFHQHIPLIICYGYFGTGKTETIKRTLANEAGSSVFVNCVGIYHAKELFGDIVQQLDPGARIDAIPQLLVFFSRLQQIQKQKQSTIYIAFDGIDYLLDRGMENVVEAFLRLNDTLCYDLSIRLIFICNGVSPELRRLVASYVPVYLHFPSIPDSVIIPVIVGECRKYTNLFAWVSTGQKQKKLEEYGWTVKKYNTMLQGWIAHVYRVLKLECKVWTEILFVISKIVPLFDKYMCNPPRQETSGATNFPSLRQLVKTTSPYVAVVVGNLFHHNMPFDEVEEAAKIGHFQQTNTAQSIQKVTTILDDVDLASSTLDMEQPDEAMCWTSRTMQEQSKIRLPKRVLFLVVSSYLASFNPSDSDTLYFSTQKQARKRMRRSKGPQIRQQLLGPKPFPAQRLCAVYYSLLNENTGDNITPDESVYSQIAVLLQMQLLKRMSPPTELNDIVYQCNADFDYVENAASLINVDLKKYLHVN